MLPLKRIVCPTNFKETARTALQISNEMALYFSAELTVLHVVQPVSPIVAPVESMGIGPTSDDVSERTKQAVITAQKRLAEEVHDVVAPEVRVKLEVLVGEPAPMIVETAADADAIILATRRHGRLRNILFGSVADKVLHDAVCPVIAIHGAVADKSGIGDLQEQTSES